VKLPPHRIAQLGIGYCPEERGIFASLKLRGKPDAPAAVASGGMSLDEIYAMFPEPEGTSHEPRHAASGASRQMLAVARILRTGAKLLLLDEISEGLAPVIVQALAAHDPHAAREGFTIGDGRAELRFAAPLADRFYVMEHGRIVGDFRSLGTGNQERLAARVPGRLAARSFFSGESRTNRGLMKRKLISTLVGAALAVGAGAASAQVSDGVIKIGVMSDMSSLYADIGGPGSTLAARMAVEDFGAAKKGMKVEIVSADHQNKADVGSSVARQWYDVDKVDAIFVVPNSAVALADQPANARKGQGVHRLGRGVFGPDRQGLLAEYGALDLRHLDARQRHRTAIVKTGGDSWFFLTSDYAFGHALERDTEAAVIKNGGKVLGKVRHR